MLQYEGTDLSVVLAVREAELDQREAELRHGLARLEALKVEMLRRAAQLDVREAAINARTVVLRAPGAEPLAEPPLSPPLSPPSESWESSWWERRLGQPLGSGEAAAA